MAEKRQDLLGKKDRDGARLMYKKKKPKGVSELRSMTVGRFFSKQLGEVNYVSM